MRDCDGRYRGQDGRIYVFSEGLSILEKDGVREIEKVLTNKGVLIKNLEIPDRYDLVGLDEEGKKVIFARGLEKISLDWRELDIDTIK